MKEFSDLPYELRLSVLKTARRNAFKEKIRRFETIFSGAQRQWTLRKEFFGGGIIWVFRHRIKLVLVYYIHMDLLTHWVDLTFTNQTDDGMYEIYHMKDSNGKWSFKRYFMQ